MANKIGRFEILSEITHSEIGAVYKAADPESGQTIALKTIRCRCWRAGRPCWWTTSCRKPPAPSPSAATTSRNSLASKRSTASAAPPKSTCRATASRTMLARKEGFSIWDLQDIVRQTCQGLDHAHSHNVVHYSLEPAKIMVTWDGTVKVLSFGVSCMGAFTCQAAGKAPEVLHYVSPEQLRGDPVDGRSNIFSLGAILYEMATETKAFPGDDADQVRQAIGEATPRARSQINPKIHPVLSEVIMKALSKAPEERYQSGQDLVNDLERCKESATKAVAKKPAQAAACERGPAAKAPVARRRKRPAHLSRRTAQYDSCTRSCACCQRCECGAIFFFTFSGAKPRLRPRDGRAQARFPRVASGESAAAEASPSPAKCPDKAIFRSEPVPWPMSRTRATGKPCVPG